MPLTPRESPPIVIVAYGPGRVTRAAIDRAKGLSERVIVVAGLPGVTDDETSGSTALAAALRSLPDGPVIFVHDDILLTRSTLAALHDAWTERGGVVVPWSNDVGMDHFAGALPEARKAAGRIVEVARSKQVARRARVLRPSCVLAARDELIDLCASHIADPRMRLEAVALDAWIAPRAVVAHDSACIRRSVPIGADRPLVVAAMIVKDEEASLPECLASLRGLVDEIVLCDTGSTDRTVEIARKHGATVIHRDWRGDFGWARTEALDAAAHGVWVLTVDADDRIVCDDVERVRSILSSYRDEYEAINVVVRNAIGDGEQGSVFDSPRLFRGGAMRYDGRVHEVLVRKSDGTPPFAPRLEGVELTHIGYRADIMAGRDKTNRNLTLAREAYERSPSPKHAIEYARSLRLAGAGRRESYALLAKVVAEAVGTDSRVLAYCETLMAQDMLDLGEAETALRHAASALERLPADDGAARVHHLAALSLARPAAVVEAETTRLGRRSLRPLFQGEAAKDDVQTLVSQAFPALIRAEPPARTAALCAAYAAAGGERPEAVFAGLMAALVCGDDDAFRALAAFVGRLDPAVIDGIEQSARRRGRDDLCAALKAAANA